MARSRARKNKKASTSERKSYVPWKRAGFDFKPFPPQVPTNVLDNLFAALGLRADVNPTTQSPQVNLMEQGKENENKDYYEAVLSEIKQRGISGGGLMPQATSTQQQAPALPNNEGPDLGKLHWTTIARLIHVFTTARRLLVDKANDEKERMVYKKQQKQPSEPAQAAGPAGPAGSAGTATATATAKEIIGDDSDDDENEGQGGGGMVVEKDTDDESLFVTQRPDYEAGTQTNQQNRFVSLVDEWIQHLDVAKGVALSNKDIEAMEMF
ncbi:hypothetical protein PG984_004978 [Apiospora sp. TS-2023a]